MADRDPWIKFYPKDYLSDLELATCSAAAQGVYMRLLCLMHNSNEYGFAIVSGAVPTPHSLAKVVQIRYPTCTNAVAELLQKCVLKKDHRGVLYSQRMLSDKEKLDVMRERGKLGGNPALVNRKDKPEQMEMEKENKKEIKSSASAYTLDFESWWQEWPEKRDKGKAFRCWQKLIKEGIAPYTLTLAARNYIIDCKRSDRFLKNAATFLGPDRPWEDYLSGIPADSPASRCCGTCKRGPAKGSEKYCTAKFDGVMMGSRLFDDEPCEKWEA